MKSETASFEEKIRCPIQEKGGSSGRERRGEESPACLLPRTGKRSRGKKGSSFPVGKIREEKTQGVLRERGRGRKRAPGGKGEKGSRQEKNLVLPRASVCEGE